jgi:uncharacterized protein YjbI with pentapeptide repeats
MGQDQSTQGEEVRPSIDLYDLLNRPGPLWLVGAELPRADLSYARLSNVNFYQANLQGTILDHADLTNANLRLAALQGSRLVQTRLEGADLAIANLTGARLAMATLTNARLEGATLVESNLNGARLDNAHLSHADLRGATLRRASLQEADLSVADLRGADLEGADLTDAILINANLQGANLHNAILTGIVYDAQTVWPDGFHPENSTTSEVAVSTLQRQELRLQVNLTRDFVSHFNQLAEPGDIAHIDHISDLGLLREIHSGQRMAVFKSVALAEDLVPRFAGYLDLIGYNLEHGPVNPLVDQQDPIAAAQRMRAVADSYGLRLAIGPDHNFVLSHGLQMAPYADQFILQVQRVQAQPELVRSYVISTSAALREANPAIEVIVQVRTEGVPDTLVELLRSLEAHIDGIAILTSPQTTETAATLWGRLRQQGSQLAPVEAPDRTYRFGLQEVGLLLQGLLLQIVAVAALVITSWLCHRLLSRVGRNS